MPNTLGLDDDFEPVEVVQDLEKAFGIKITIRHLLRYMLLQWARIPVIIGLKVLQMR